MEDTMILENTSEEGGSNDFISSMLLKKMCDGSRRDTADDVEEEADRIMAELIDRPAVHSAVKDDSDEERLSDDDDVNYSEDTDEDDKSHIRKSISTNSRKSKAVGNFVCKLCGKKFQKEGGLTRHMNTVHPNGQVLRFKCSKCGKGFTKRHHMKNHEAIHGPPTARCDLCPAVFASKDTLIIHKARDHKMTMDNKPILKALPCPTCSQRFESPLQLRNHSYVCLRNLEKKEIKRVDKLSKLLKRSKEPILKEKVPVTPCEKCGKAFGSEYGKSRHIRKHHPAFAEQIVADKNSWRQSLPHECELCGKRFKQAVALKYHYMRHTGALPFKCDQCESAYPLACELSKHKAAKHPVGIGQDDITKDDHSPTDHDTALVF